MEMLMQMYVKDFVLIDNVNLSFCDHMSAFTGETGAGKSLLIDAIGILRGDRINASLVKQGKEKAIIEGVFHISNDHLAAKLLEEAGFDIEDDTIIITREFTKDGKSVSRINHRTTTVSIIKQILSTMIDIHSQHDSQYLLNNKYHLSLLDSYCHEDALIQDVQIAYKEFHRISKQLNDALENEYNEDDLDFLTFQLNEIDEADLKEHELEELEEEQRRFMAYEKTSVALHQCMERLNGDQGANAIVYEAGRLLEGLQADEIISQSKDKLMDLYYALEDQYQILNDYMEQLEYDEERVNEISERIFLINKIIRKYGGSFTQVMKKREELEQRIDMILHRSDVIKKMEQGKQKAYDAFYEKANHLHEIRLAKAKEMETAIVEQLRDLHLEQAKFHVDIQLIEGNTHGIDQVEFLISMNRGEPLRPLANTASGGELSRLMLGLKTIFSHLQGIQTVIFDEIDTGVSGSVAFAIGRKMKQLSNHAQVFCVTHLAQVAACADHQYLVVKDQNETSTKTDIQELKEEERIIQLAKIASDSTSDHALLAAKELYEKAQTK